MIEIEGKKVTESNYLDPVTYIPSHADGDASHPDCEQGVIIEPVGIHSLRVLYCKGRTVQLTQPNDLVWG